MQNVIVNLLPEISIILTSFLLLINSLYKNKNSELVNFIITIVGLILSLYFVTNQSNQTFFNGNLENSDFTKTIKILLIFATLISLFFIKSKNFNFHNEFFSEYSFLLIISLLGGLFLVSAREFFIAIISIEILSIPLYIIAATGTKSGLSVEGATKLFFFGSLSTVILVFSAVLLFVATGSTLINLSILDYKDIVSVLCFLFILIPVCFKTGLLPMHFWISDVYQSSPPRLLTYLSTVPKIAVISFFINIMMGDGSQILEVKLFKYILSIFCFISIFYGSILTLRQTNLMRLLAYSGIPHAGMMLLFSIVYIGDSFEFMRIYFSFYILSNTCLYLCISNLDNYEKGGIDSLKGLYNDSIFISICLAISILSLAGTPLTYGFWAKFNLIILMYKTNGLLYSVLILIGSMISFYYYLRLIKEIFSDKKINTKNKILISLNDKSIIAICAILIILLGLSPNLIKILS